MGDAIGGQGAEGQWVTGHACPVDSSLFSEVQGEIQSSHTGDQGHLGSGGGSAERRALCCAQVRSRRGRGEVEAGQGALSQGWAYAVAQCADKQNKYLSQLGTVPTCSRLPYGRQNDKNTQPLQERQQPASPFGDCKVWRDAVDIAIDTATVLRCVQVCV
eukprot:GGOE01006697.1.p1 GENE.GGOE01006697.1~~GGOE01006697.1.p1  ORF type:complete len:172 (-),score=1.61 GGOE01006697.1:97-576(-)